MVYVRAWNDSILINATYYGDSSTYFAVGISPSHFYPAWHTDTKAPCWDLDEDGYEDRACGGDDCDDSDPTIYPDATDVCDDVDQDCDGSDGSPEACDNGIDDDCDGLGDWWDTDCCDDFDGDAFTDTACGGGDCDDTDPLVNPGHPEVAGDGIDNDCDGQIDEGCFIGVVRIGI